jgi:hypothetical protein
LPYLVATPEELRTALESRAQVLEESRTELRARAERLVAADVPGRADDELA